MREVIQTAKNLIFIFLPFLSPHRFYYYIVTRKNGHKTARTHSVHTNTWAALTTPERVHARENFLLFFGGQPMLHRVKFWLDRFPIYIPHCSFPLSAGAFIQFADDYLAIKMHITSEAHRKKVLRWTWGERRPPSDKFLFYIHFFFCEVEKNGQKEKGRQTKVDSESIHYSRFVSAGPRSAWT